MKHDIDRVHEVGDRLARESARYAALGWKRATSGNLSEVLARDPLRLVVTASGFDKGELKHDSIAVVDEMGLPVRVEGLAVRKPSDEAALHSRIVVRTGAGAVAHVHPINAVLAGRRWPDGIVLRDLEMLKALGRGAHDDDVIVPVIANSQDMSELADRFDGVYDPLVPAVVVADHGLYVWGRDHTQARHRCEALDWLFAVVLQSQ